MVAYDKESSQNSYYVYNLEMDEIQFTFEGTSFGRYRLDQFGERITVSQYVDEHKIAVYHEDGSLWQELELDLPDGVYVGGAYVSAHFFDNDDELEYVFNYWGFEDQGRGVKVLDNTGEELLFDDGAMTFICSYIPGADNKLLTSSTGYEAESFTKVYGVQSSAPGLQLNEWASDDLQVYPNPVSNRLHLNIEEAFGTGSMEVYDMSGRKVLEQELDQQKSSYDVSSLKAGMYSIRVISETEVFQQKFMKL